MNDRQGSPNKRVQRTRLRSPLTRRPLVSAKLSLAALLLGLLAGRVALACSCVQIPGDGGLPEIDLLAGESSVVLLVGTVTEVRSLASAEDIAALSPDLRERAPHFFGTEATLQVDSYWSGAQLRSAIVVQTGNVGGGCGVPWNPGECFFIEAWLEDGLWKTSTCSMTAPIAAARETLEKLIVTDGPGKRTSK